MHRYTGKLCRQMDWEKSRNGEGERKINCETDKRKSRWEENRG